MEGLNYMYGIDVQGFQQLVTPEPAKEVGKKFDSGKVRFSLLTRGLAHVQKEIAAVLTFGATKYGIDNWKYVDNAKQRYEDALERHLNAWRQGEALDSETGLHHLAHAATNVLFLLYFELKDID